jgi:hypothetical protein
MRSGDSRPAAPLPQGSARSPGVLSDSRPPLVFAYKIDCVRDERAAGWKNEARPGGSARVDGDGDRSRDCTFVCPITH